MLPRLFTHMLCENCSLPLMVLLPFSLFFGALLNYFQDGRDEGETNMTQTHQQNIKIFSSLSLCSSLALYLYYQNFTNMCFQKYLIDITIKL